MNLKRRPFVVQSDTHTCIEANAAGKSMAMICSQSETNHLHLDERFESKVYTV